MFVMQVSDMCQDPKTGSGFGFLGAGSKDLLGSRIFFEILSWDLVGFWIFFYVVTGSSGILYIFPIGILSRRPWPSDLTYLPKMT